jgi:hypothetical protein
VTRIFSKNKKIVNISPSLLGICYQMIFTDLFGQIDNVKLFFLPPNELNPFDVLSDFNVFQKSKNTNRLIWFGFDPFKLR